ncbi:hypothetical protein Oweho_0283 [Owenweeksia hongkongensis DSM 17368]|uniref:Sce7725 family protein n=1 Tax=Owenweeksia hongkongensis (strain DSM 17368 / CIP 108786 / JCM 12287 / NRRL B-23963 / UST20020801) TaxID=926562 RepID=G8R7Y2_OWEHD|nr:sce7725 family protein [Owenweeksia hongkongensis]AEV31305.1 hypothetical protein Oweho_0283 [Owenweeksia hongkongensis DSM 17368]
MYYPLLRARQFELIALRELAMEGRTQDTVLPILEPVKKSHNNFDLAYKVFRETNQRVFVIANPTVGEMNGDHSYYADYISSLDQSVFMPAFHFRNNSTYISDLIDKYAFNNCLLLCQNDVSSDDSGLEQLLSMDAVTSVVVEDPGRNRSLDRFIRRFGKAYIRLDDLFEKQARNKDFLEIENHRFSEEHLYFDEENFDGFSDFTILPSEYAEGGSTPRAVVIHLTYLNEKDQIWIRHFTSDTNDSIANIQGKFAEAAEKAVSYCRSHGLNNSAIKELEEFYDEQHYPGLGTVKKLSIKNHLLIVSQYLRRK